jgi:WD40 repeat protein
MRRFLSLAAVLLGSAAPLSAEEKHALRYDLSDGPSGSVTAVAFSPDSTLLAAVRDYTRLRLWDTRTGKLVAKIDGYGGKNAYIRTQGLRFSPDGKLLVGGVLDGLDGMPGTVLVWDVSDPANIKRIEGFKGHSPSGVFVVAFTPDGKTLITAGDDKEIRYWDVATRKETRKLTGHTGRVLSMELSADGKVLVSGDSDEVRVWDAASGRQTASWKVDKLLGLAILPDVKTVAVRTSTTQTEFWDVAAARRKGATDPVTGSVAEVTGAMSRAMFTCKNGDLLSAAYSPDGKWYATGGYEQLGRATTQLFSVTRP